MSSEPVYSGGTHLQTARSEFGKARGSVGNAMAFLLSHMLAAPVNSPAATFGVQLAGIWNGLNFIALHQMPAIGLEVEKLERLDADDAFATTSLVLACQTATRAVGEVINQLSVACQTEELPDSVGTAVELAQRAIEQLGVATDALQVMQTTY